MGAGGAAADADSNGSAAGRDLLAVPTCQQNLTTARNQLSTCQKSVTDLNTKLAAAQVRLRPHVTAAVCHPRGTARRPC